MSAQYFETKIPFVALDLVHSLVVARRATGEWPSQESIALPAGVKSISLDPSEDFLEVCIVGDEALLLRCRIGGDGEVIIPPKFVQDPVEWDVPIATQTEEQGSR